MADDVQDQDVDGTDVPAGRVDRRQEQVYVFDDEVRDYVRNILYWLDPSVDFNRRESALVQIERLLGGLDG